MFSKETYIQRREKLKRLVGQGIVLLLGNEESSMNYKDNWYPFRQDSSFLYFIGLDRSGLAAVIDLESGEEMLFGNEASVEDIVWNGTEVSVQEQAAQAGILVVKPYAALDVLLQQAVSRQRQVHYLPPYRPENKLK